MRVDLHVEGVEQCRLLLFRQGGIGFYASTFGTQILEPLPACTFLSECDFRRVGDGDLLAVTLTALMDTVEVDDHAKWL